jgi:hypothetical protein
MDQLGAWQPSPSPFLLPLAMDGYSDKSHTLNDTDLHRCRLLSFYPNNPLIEPSRDGFDKRPGPEIERIAIRKFDRPPTIDHVMMLLAAPRGIEIRNLDPRPFPERDRIGMARNSRLRVAADHARLALGRVQELLIAIVTHINAFTVVEIV